MDTPHGGQTGIGGAGNFYSPFKVVLCEAAPLDPPLLVCKMGLLRTP